MRILMHYVNEQITRTFEHLLNLRTKYHSMDTLIPSPKTARIFYRINHEKLAKYRNENHSTSKKNYLPMDNNRIVEKENNLIPTIKVLSNKIIHRMTIGTQTTFSKPSNPPINFLHPFVNRSSIVTKGIEEIIFSKYCKLFI